MNRQPHVYNVLLHMQQKVVSPGSGVQRSKLISENSLLDRGGEGKPICGTQTQGVACRFDLPSAVFFRADQLIQIEPRLASQARHRFVALQETFAPRIVVLGGYGVFENDSASATAFNIALALFTVSWYSASGVESFTQPPPACT